jgi:plasmid maintenance system antidote protein VapI
MSEAEKRVDKLLNGRTTLFKELVARHGKSPDEKEKFWIELEKVLLKYQHLLPETKEEKK